MIAFTEKKLSVILFPVPETAPPPYLLMFTSIPRHPKSKANDIHPVIAHYQCRLCKLIKPLGK